MVKSTLVISIIVVFIEALLSSCGQRQTLVATQGEKNANQSQQTRLDGLITSWESNERDNSRRNEKPVIMSRQEWNAKVPVGEAKQHTIRFITIHHTASLQKKVTTIEKKMQSLQNFSQSESRLASGKMKPVWFDVPYHYYVAVDGKIAEGRDIRFVGDTNTDYDPTGHALIVLEGNFQTERPSDAQMESLRTLVAWLSERWNVSVASIKAHNDYASTECPGENVKALLPALREKVGEIMKRDHRP